MLTARHTVHLPVPNPSLPSQHLLREQPHGPRAPLPRPWRSFAFCRLSREGGIAKGMAVYEAVAVVIRGGLL